jgi:DNA-binding MarR family transcriptional regulator
MSTVARTESLRLLEHEVGVLIRRVKRVLGERARRVHPELGGGSYLMLAYLADTGPMRSSAIADVFGIDKGAISRQVQHLVDLGLVAREPDADDKRASLLSATPEAVSRLADVVEHRRKWLGEQLGDWSDEELAGFGRMLARYNQALNAS